MTTPGMLIDHGRIAGQPLHLQDIRKGPCTGAHGRPAAAWRRCPGSAEGRHAADDGPVFANRDGGWVSLVNTPRSLRAALPDDLKKTITRYTVRRAVPTVGRNKTGADKAQLSHAKLATTEKHYLQRHTHGPDVRQVLDEYVGVQG